MSSSVTDGPTPGSAASRTVLGRGLLYTVGTAAPVLSNAAATPFVTRAIGPTEYGVVAIATDDAKTLAADEGLRHAYLGF